MKRIFIEETIKQVGKEIKVAGWINSRRDHGKIIFLDLRDKSGIIQIVVDPESDAYKEAVILRPEWVVEVVGSISKRPKNMVNQDIISGDIELLADKIKILNQAKTPPFEIDKDTSNIDEELRFKYRYLDIRSSRVTENITLRHNTVKFIRDYLDEKGFRDIETPYLTKSTPEGAREFIIPSRLYPGEFYVLPQSPQQFKQLLMVAGIERYYQIARCFRDEDQRGDRQPEFTQLDIEMSFIEQEDILEFIENMMIQLVKKIVPNKKISEIPFPRIKYSDAIKEHDTDKPDLRKDKDDNKELAFAWIINPPLFKYSQTDKKLVSSHHPFTMPDENDLSMLDDQPENVRAHSYDLVLNGYEIAGGSIRIHNKDLQSKIFRILNLADDEVSRRFGHMLEALEFGAPPHGGIAAGIDRIVAILANEKVIREVIVFPKTGDARDLMMGAPSYVSEKQLKDVHIHLAANAKGKALKNTDTTTNE